MRPGLPEILILLLIVVLLFGAKKLPELARGMGRSIKEFKKATSDDSDDENDEEKADSSKNGATRKTDVASKN